MGWRGGVVPASASLGLPVCAVGAWSSSGPRGDSERGCPFASSRTRVALGELLTRVSVVAAAVLRQKLKRIKTKREEGNRKCKGTKTGPGIPQVGHLERPSFWWRVVFTKEGRPSRDEASQVIRFFLSLIEPVPHRSVCVPDQQHGPHLGAC